MDRYDRDPWHDAETLPLWFLILVIVILAIACLVEFNSN